MSSSIALVYAPSKHKVSAIFSLPCLGGYLKRQGVDVSVIDAPLSGYGVSETLDRLRQLNPDVIGISIPFTLLVHESVEFMKLVRAAFPDTLLICGGVHPTLVPMDVAPFCDAAVIGDGEITTRELLERYVSGDEWRDTPGICFLGSEGKLVFSEPRKPEEDLDALGGPDWSLIPFEQWKTTFYFHIEGEIAMPLMSGRGCPFACTFCANEKLTGRRVRFRSIPSFLEDIEGVIETFGIRSFFFHDEVFTINKARLREFCDEAKGRNLKFKFLAQTRADRVDEEDIRLLTEAGCVALGFGLESADPEINRRMNRNLDLDRVRETIALCRKYGLMCSLSFMIGTPWETFDTLRTTFNFINEVGPDSIGFFFFIPYPGTKMFDDALEIGGLNYIDWSDAMSSQPEHDVYRAPTLRNVHPGLVRDSVMWHYYTRSLRRFMQYLSMYSWRGGLPQLARCYRSMRKLKKQGLAFS